MARCNAFDIDVLPENFHISNDGYNLYAGDILKIAKYGAEEDSEGKLKSEKRVFISVEELLS